MASMAFLRSVENYFNFRDFLFYFYTTNKFWNHFNINLHVFVDDADQLGLGARKTVLGNYEQQRSRPACICAV